MLKNVMTVLLVAVLSGSLKAEDICENQGLTVPTVPVGTPASPLVAPGPSSGIPCLLSVFGASVAEFIQNNEEQHAYSWPIPRVTVRLRTLAPKRTLLVQSTRGLDESVTPMLMEIYRQELKFPQPEGVTDGQLRVFIHKDGPGPAPSTAEVLVMVTKNNEVASILQAPLNLTLAPACLEQTVAAPVCLTVEAYSNSMVVSLVEAARTQTLQVQAYADKARIGNIHTEEGDASQGVNLVHIIR